MNKNEPLIDIRSINVINEADKLVEESILASALTPTHAEVMLKQYDERRMAVLNALAELHEIQLRHFSAAVVREQEQADHQNVEIMALLIENNLKAEAPVKAA